MCTINIDTKNEAFQGGNRDYEITRIINKIKGKIEQGETGGVILDINGNGVGMWQLD